MRKENQTNTVPHRLPRTEVATHTATEVSQKRGKEKERVVLGVKGKVFEGRGGVERFEEEIKQ